jgi:hypothetical protein
MFWEKPMGFPKRVFCGIELLEYHAMFTTVGKLWCRISPAHPLK